MSIAMQLLGVNCLSLVSLFYIPYYRQTARLGTCGANRDRVTYTALRNDDEMFLSVSIGGIRGRARQETNAGLTLLSLSLLAGLQSNRNCGPM